MTNYAGLHVPLITPFDAAGAVALDALHRLAHEVLDAGATGLVALGTTAEPSALTPAERDRILTLLTGVCDDRDAGLLIGANDAEALQALGSRLAVTGALTLVPPFLRPGEDGVLAHLAALAAHSPVPLIVYHVPYRTGQPLSATALHRLAAIPGVAGIKYAAGGIDATTVEFMSALPAGFTVLAGDDALLTPMLALGAHGGICASAHVATTAYANLVASWRTHQHGSRLARLSAALFAEPNPTVVKGVLHAQGRIPTPAVRLPFLPAAATSIGRALAELDDEPFVGDQDLPAEHGRRRVPA